MFRKMFAAVMSMILSISIIACGSEDKTGATTSRYETSVSASSSTKEDKESEIDVSKDTSISVSADKNTQEISEEMGVSFEKDLEEYIRSVGFENENYIVSPLSFRAALCLAIAGSNGDTKEALLKVSNFNSEDEMLEWYKSVKDARNVFYSQ